MNRLNDVGSLETTGTVPLIQYLETTISQFNKIGPQVYIWTFKGSPRILNSHFGDISIYKIFLFCFV